MSQSESAVAANLSQALVEITAEVLETMFYIFPEEEPCPEDTAPEPPVAAAFQFEGLPSGTVVIVISAASARAAAANFLAIEEEEVSPGQLAEIVCEMANMVGGCLLTCIENRTPLQPLPPHNVAPGAYSARQPAASHQFYLEHGALTVSFYWE